MQITAQLNRLRIAPRKVRMVTKVLPGLDVDSARVRLQYITKKSSRPLEKLLDSALANARNNKGLNSDHLYIKDVIVNEGMKLKRFKPRGFGMVMPIHKQSSNIKIVLEELSGDRLEKAKMRLAKKKIIQEAENTPHSSKEVTRSVLDEKQTIGKPKFKEKPEIGKKKNIFGGIQNIGKKMFRRKSV